MNNVRNIVLIGSTGNGKSTLGNVLVNKGGNFQEVFKEGEFGVSQTHETKVEEFWENGIRYRVIDTVGIGDTSLTEQQVLYRIANAAHRVKDGLSQVLFVTSGRFNSQEVFAYNVLRKFVFDEDIVKYTTIVRTRFENFSNYNKCREDEMKMTNENPELCELISGCKKVVHVDNPSLSINNERRLVLNREDRRSSRMIMLSHLMNCQTIYKPKNLDSLTAKIDNYMTDIERLQKQLNDERNLSETERRRLQSEISDLKGKVSQETKGVFQKAVGAVGEAAGYVVDKTVEITWNVVSYPFRGCDIM